MEIKTKAFFFLWSITYVARAETISLNIDRGQVLQLQKSVEISYLSYLEERRAKLVRAVDGLLFSGKFSSPLDVLELLDTRSESYPNRNYHCHFLNRIRDFLTDERDAHTFEVLFQHGRVCLASDLPSNKQGEWGKRVANFFWTAKWLRFGKTAVSLKDLVRLKLGISIDVEVTNWNFRWDATYGNLSPSDTEFIRNTPKLRGIFAALNPLDINSLHVPKYMGSDIALYAKERPVYFPDVFSKNTTMYMSPSIGPADMPEVLLHEFGHIYFDMHRSNFSKNGSNITYSKPAQHDEACAELLPWILLEPFYSEHPELEVIHVVKLLGLGRVKPLDPHFVGSGAVFQKLTEPTEGRERFYRKLVKSSDFRRFVTSVGGVDLIETLDAKQRTLRISTSRQ